MTVAPQFLGASSGPSPVPQFCAWKCWSNKNVTAQPWVDSQTEWTPPRGWTEFRLHLGRSRSVRAPVDGVAVGLLVGVASARLRVPAQTSTCRVRAPFNLRHPRTHTYSAIPSPSESSFPLSWHLNCNVSVRKRDPAVSTSLACTRVLVI